MPMERGSWREKTNQRSFATGSSQKEIDMGQRKTFLPLLMLVAIVLITPQVYAGQSRTDGNWWLKMTFSNKLYYMVGFYNGMDLGQQFIIWEMAKTRTEEKAFLKVSNLYDRHLKFFRKFSHGQLVHGVNAFYGDPNNRNIFIQHAVWVVGQKLAGKPPAEIEKLVELFRKMAGMSMTTQ
jgi:hypothetical protein